MAQETQKRGPAIAEVESANVVLPQPGDIFRAKIVKLGMTTAGEVYGKDAQNPDGPVIVFFFESESGIRGSQPMGFYKVPSPRTKLYSLVRKYGQPKVGMIVNVTRDDKGYWGIAL